MAFWWLVRLQHWAVRLVTDPTLDFGTDDELPYPMLLTSNKPRRSGRCHVLTCGLLLLGALAYPGSAF